MLGLNTLRTAYVRSPRPVRRILSPVLAALPVRYRFGGTYVSFRASIERSRQDTEFVRAWRRDHLRKLVSAAVSHAPHYRDLARTLGLSAAVIENFEVDDLRIFPVLTKDALRGRAADFLTRPMDELDEVSTSGSSGTPLSFFLDKDRSAAEWAFVQDSWSKVGFSPKDIRAVFRGLHLQDVDRTPWEFEPSLGELRLSPFHLTDHWMNKYCALIARYNASFLHGYPSALDIFASYVLRSKRTDIAGRVRGVLAISETLFDHQRARISLAFPNAKLTSFYGMSEKVLFGTEIPGRPATFEMEPLYGIAELVDDAGNRITEPGKKGRVVGTGLLLSGMPFIRYDTGDVGTLVEDANEGNRFRAVIAGIASRWGQEFLVGRGGQLISMTAINIHSGAYVKMAAFQFHQREPGRAALRAVLAAGSTEADIVPFMNEISAKIGESISFDLELVDELTRNERGKSKFIDQRLDLRKFQ